MKVHLMDLSANSPVVIVGAGLIGASLGCALVERGVEVFLSDVNPVHAAVAASRGAGRLDPVDPRQVKAVFVAVPPDRCAQVIAESLERYPYAAVSDTASVKAEIMASVAEHDHKERYVGGHPMAGSHHAGPLMAMSKMFSERTWVLTCSDDTSDEAIATITALIDATGARRVNVDPVDHDRIVAALSHLPQLVSSLTAAQLVDIAPSELNLAGQGLRDVTRIAASDVELWRQIIRANDQAVYERLCTLRDDLDHLLNHFDSDETIVDLLTRGNRGVEQIPSRAGKDMRCLARVIVAIPDTPGAIASLVTKICAWGVNIEDLSIEHDPVENRGYLSIDVSTDEADRLRQSLMEAGWTIYGERI